MSPQERKEYELINLKIDQFIEKNVCCKTCQFCVNDLFGTRCEPPDMCPGESAETGFEISDLSSSCETFEFIDPKKEKEMSSLSNRLAKIIIKDAKEKNELAEF